MIRALVQTRFMAVKRKAKTASKSTVAPRVLRRDMLGNMGTTLLEVAVGLFVTGGIVFLLSLMMQK